MGVCIQKIQISSCIFAETQKRGENVAEITKPKRRVAVGCRVGVSDNPQGYSRNRLSGGTSDGRRYA